MTDNVSHNSVAARASALSLRGWLELGKHRIASLAALSAGTGYILAAQTIDARLALVMGATALLAAAAGAINQLQEIEIDSRMQRTAGRPLPAGQIATATAMAFAAILAAAGTALLYFGASLLTTGLGLLAMASYNLLYTPLKRVSAFAALPGSIVGAIPPMLGWAAAGRSIGEAPILALAAYFFIWQIPHFWLLLLYFAEDYERSGLPCLTRVWTPERIARATFIGVALTALTAGLVMPLALTVSTPLEITALAAVSLWLVWASRGLLRPAALRGNAIKKAFMSINFYALFVMMILAAAALW